MDTIGSFSRVLYASPSDFESSVEQIRLRHPNVELSVGKGNPDSAGVTYHKLHMIRSLTQGQGEGNAVMHELTSAADKHGVGLHLTPEKVGQGMSTTKLKSWYKSHGFSKNTDYALSGTMYRAPQTV